MDDDLAQAEDLLVAVAPVEVVIAGHDTEVPVTAGKAKNHRISP